MINVTKVELPDINEYKKYVDLIWKNEWVTNNGELVLGLEKKLEEYLGVKNLLLTSNGTLAIQLPLKGLKLEGEVITTPFTFVATTNSIIWEGLTPVFADIDPKTFCIDPDDVEKKITNKTSAILAVHVYGNPCNVERLEAIAKKHNLKLIFDAAHAFGVEYNGQSVLNHGDVSTLSFHATKVFNTIEGGAIIVKDDELYENIKSLRNFGIISEEEVTAPGINAKMNEFQAAMGLCNLSLLDDKIAKRKEILERYKGGLSKTNRITFQENIASKYNYSYMPVVFESKEIRDSIAEALSENDIKARKYFYPLTSDFECMSAYNKNNTPVAKKISDGILCLPMYSSLLAQDVDKIISVILSKLN